MTREMKYSGVEWIGNIPSEWLIRKIKNVCNIYTGNSIKDNEKNNFTDSTNAIPYIATKDIDVSSSKINYDNGMYVKNDDENFKVASKHSTLMCIEGGSAGKKIAYLNQDVCFVNKLCCFNAKTMDNKFLHFYLKSPSFNSEFNLHISGLIGGVSQGELKEFSIAIPPLSEQKKIADFLDGKVAEIDKIIAETKSSIENYKEYKQSVITEAVTKGLDKNVPMKDSGIEWIGDIPSEWKIYRLKNCFTEHIGGAWGEEPRGNENDIICIRVADFDYDRMTIKKSDNYEYTKRNYTNDTIAKLKLKKNNILIEKSGGGEKTPVGRTIIFKEDFEALYANFIEKLNVSKYALPDFVQYLLVAFYKNKYTTKYIKQTTGIQNLDIVSMLSNESIVLPTLNKQKEISNFLDYKVSEINKFISEKEQLISNLEEYKKSLIYEYVTGKRTVE